MNRQWPEQAALHKLEYFESIPTVLGRLRYRIEDDVLCKIISRNPRNLLDGEGPSPHGKVRGCKRSKTLRKVRPD